MVDRECLELDAVHAFVGGRLAPAAADSVEQHLDRCSQCRILVAAAARRTTARGWQPARPANETTPAGAGFAATQPHGEEPLQVARRAAGHPAAGTRIDRYVVERPLGAGGMGVVSLADDPELQRKVCLKLLRPELLDPGDRDVTRARLLREAQAMAQISHPNVVPIFDVGTHEDQVFIAMEYVAGDDMAAWLRSARRRPAEILEVFRAAGRGLVAAHRAGLIHRDFKPQNVLIGRDGTVKVADFGLARAELARPDVVRTDVGRRRAAGQEKDLLGSPITHTGTFLGTPAYMAPEQYFGHSVDARCDQFAFAVALYEALLGERPFAGSSIGEIFTAAFEGRVRPMSKRDGVSRRMRAAIARGLRAAPAARFPTMEAFLAELAPRRSRRRALAAAVALVVVGGLAAWDLAFRVHVDHYRSYVRRWGEPVGLYPLDEGEARAQSSSVKLIRKGRLGRVSRVELLNDHGPNLWSGPELDLGMEAKGERHPVRWDFEYETGSDTVSAEVARDRAGRVLYTLQYRSGPKERRKAEYLDERGFNANVRHGSAELVEFVRSAAGFDEEERYFTRTGKPARDGNGVSIERSRYDSRGNVIMSTVLDEEGRPTRHKAMGLAGADVRYDERGNMTAVTALDEAGRPTRIKEGYAAWHSTFDERGNEIARALLDEEKRPTRVKGGGAAWRSTFDERGNQIERMYLDEAGRPIRLSDGHAGWRSTFDEGDNETGRMYVDETGRPAWVRAGFQGIRWTYDEQGNQTEIDFVDEQGRRTRTAEGVAGVRSRFDERGNEVERLLIDEAGRPSRHKGGYAGLRQKFDERNNMTEQIFIDQDGRPTRSHIEDTAGRRSTFDGRSNEIERVMVDEAGRPVRHRDGYVSLRQRFDEWGNQIERLFLDEAGRPTRRLRFDARGNITELVVAFDEAGNPRTGAEGVAGWRSKFDARDNELERSFMDEAGRPTRHKDGYAGWRSRFDHWNNMIEMTFVDEAGRPARSAEGMAVSRSTFDRWDNMIERTFLDEAGQPAWHRDGYVGWRSKFDRWGNQIEIMFLDEAGKPTKHSGGYAGLRETFDRWGNVTDRVYLDQAGQEIPKTGGAQPLPGDEAALDGRYFFNLCLTLDAAGRHKEALRACKRALARGGDKELVQKIQARLKALRKKAGRP